MSLMAGATSALQPGRVREGISVMIIDDSLVFRGLASRWLSETPGIGAVVAYGKPQGALQELEVNPPDVVVLDVHMPGSDGFAVLPTILSHNPGLPVILVTATSDAAGALETRARQAGAAGFLSKPGSTRGADVARDFRRALVEMVVARASESAPASRQANIRPQQRRLEGPGHRQSADFVVRNDAGPARPLAARGARLPLRSLSRVVPRIIVVGGSTGGPKALMEIVAGITDSCDGVPVVVVQHMPDNFTVLLAEHLGRKANRESRRPGAGEAVRPGVIYVAPGGRHLLLEQHNGRVVFGFDDGPAVNFCKPAVDPMFESAAAIYKAATLALVLTGMGQDGLVGARAVAMAGGTVVAQDEATSVVWGMPGVVARAGLCSGVWPIGEFGPRITRILRGERTS